MNPIDSARTKLRINVVLATDEREALERLAAERRVSMSQCIGQLIREEEARARRRG